MRPEYNFTPSYHEVESYAQIHESLSFRIIESVRKDKDLFYDFMDYLCSDEESFHTFAELLRNFVLDDHEYLDKSLLLRDFSRAQLIHFSEEKAHHILVNR